MTGTNHALTGAMIGFSLGNPILVVPAAFISHFILDSIPHFGYEKGGFGNALKHKLTWLVLILELLGLTALVFTLRNSQTIVFVGMLVAISPDIYNLYRYFIIQKQEEHPTSELNAFTRFHKKIQWCERPWGLIVEILFFFACYYLVQARV